MPFRRIGTDWRTCEECGDRFDGASQPRQKYCSSRCRDRVNNAKNYLRRRDKQTDPKLTNRGTPRVREFKGRKAPQRPPCDACDGVGSFGKGWNRVQCKKCRGSGHKR